MLCQNLMVMQDLAGRSRGVEPTIRNCSDPLWTPNLSMISETWKPKPALIIAIPRNQCYVRYIEIERGAYRAR